MFQSVRAMVLKQDASIGACQRLARDKALVGFDSNGSFDTAELRVGAEGLIDHDEAGFNCTRSYLVGMRNPPPVGREFSFWTRPMLTRGEQRENYLLSTVT